VAGPLQRLRTAFAPPPRRTLTAASRPAAASLPPVGSLPVNAQGRTSALGGRRTVGQEWQLDAQAYFDTLGCIKYAARYVGNAYARIVLYPAVVVTDDENPVGVTDLLTDAAPPSAGGDGEGTPLPVPRDLLEQAQVEMARVRSAVDGQAGILRDIGVNFTVPGECYACCRPETPTARETWDIYSVSEMVRRDPDPLTGAERWALRGDGMTLDRPLPDDAFVRRLYWPHPFRKQLADSPLRGILDDLEELALLNRSIRSTAKSRIAGSGIFLVPNELDYDADNPADPDGLDALTRDLAIHLQAPLSDEGSAANVVPHILRGPSEHLKNVRHLRFDRPIDKDLAEQRKEKIGAIAMGLEIPPEVLLGIGDVNHWCQASETEILTTEGWQTHESLRLGDTALTLNHDTGLSEWQPVLAVNRFDVVDEPMLSIHGRDHASLSTMNHRWPVLRSRTNDRVWTTSEGLRPMDGIIAAAPSADVPQTAKYDDAFVELVGWFFTEGTCRWGNAKIPQVIIGQSHKANPGNVARIRQVLTRLYGPACEGTMQVHGEGRSHITPRWRENVETRGMTLFALNRPAAAPLLDVAPKKLVSLDFVHSLTRAQLGIFIETASRGDGSMRGGGFNVNQRKPEMLDAVEMAGVLYGRPVGRKEHLTGGFELKSQTFQRVGAPGKELVRVGGKASVVPYTGTVWCPTTANGTWLARYQGQVYYTGNSAWQVAEETFKAHIEPGILMVCAQVGSQILQALLTAHDRWAPADIARITCWYDATALINHPDQSKSAMDAYNVLELSGDALRRYMGFLDDDKPSDDEVAAHIERFRLMHSRGAEPGVIPAGDVNAPVGGQVLPTTVPGQPQPAAQQAVNPGAPAVPSTTAPAAPSTPPARTAALVAAARQPRPLGARLAELDQRLAARVQGAADMATRRLLEKAGGRITSAAAKNRELAATARSVPKAQVASTLGRTVVASLGVDDAGLLDGGYDELLDDVDVWVEQTRDRSRQMIAAWLAQHGVTVSAAALAELAGYDEQDSEAGRQALAAGLLGYATARLYRPDMPGQDLGEGFADGSLPAGVTRRPLGVYGGQDVGQVGDQDSRGAVIPLRGVASGDRHLSFLASNGATTGAWMWVHGSPQHPFEPHEELDGEVFGEDPVADEHLLANTTAAWTGMPNWTIGDHDGCQCSAVDLVIMPGQSVDQAA